MSRDEFPSFGANDPIREMRERMNRDREAFFGGDDISRPRLSGWNPPNDFFAVPDGFADFQSPSSPGFRRNYGMPGFPGFDGEAPRHPAPAGDGPEQAIPIRVIHERTPGGSTPKNRFGTAGRNTTEIPTAKNNLTAGENAMGEKSPRLERAHSEPPKSFNQRLRATGAASPLPSSSTIPENSEYVASPRYSPRPEPDSVPAAGSNKLASSASAPSVPAANRPNNSSPPTAPPRRPKLVDQPPPTAPPPPPPPPPSRGTCDEERFSNSSSEPPKVRHIPIFVEGRNEPVLNRKTSQPEQPTSPPFRQPSEFYPPNTQKVRSQSCSSPGPASQGVPPRGLNLRPPFMQQAQEPTSPLSPPPSDQPIPMGCSDYFVNAPHAAQPTEPTTPAGPPPGPIPMPYHPDHVDGGAATPSSTPVLQPEVHQIPVHVSEAPEKPEAEAKQQQPEQQQEDKKMTPEESKLRKIDSDVADLLSRVEKFNGSRKDREYLFLDDQLTQKLCLLDGIEAAGREDIRQMRKESIKSINRCLSMLDRRATGSKADGNSCGDEDSSVMSDQVLSELASVTVNEDGPKNSNNNKS